MKLQDINKSNLLLKATAGSHAYGLNIATSDLDIRGVFMLPQNAYYGLKYTPQVSDTTNDTTYFEWSRFISLVGKSNPTALELLNTATIDIQYKHPLFSQLSPSAFLSKKCRDTFAGYARSQIKKACGLNKKIVNPVDKKRKSILDFCYVLKGQGSMPLLKWLTIHALQQEHCGLVSIAHMEGIFGLYYDKTGDLAYKGIMRKSNANEVLLSSIPKGEMPLTYLYFNQNGYSKYCKDYRNYWDWVVQRNEARYKNTLEHGKNYDAKNMMHTFRLLHMAEEILRHGKLIVKRPDRAFLLSVRAGQFAYDELVQLAEQKLAAVDKAYQISKLPAAPDLDVLEQVAIQVRKSFYRNG